MTNTRWKCDACGVRLPDGYSWLCDPCTTRNREDLAALPASEPSPRELMGEPPAAPVSDGGPFTLDALAADRHGDRWGVPR